MVITNFLGTGGCFAIIQLYCFLFVDGCKNFGRNRISPGVPLCLFGERFEHH